MTHHNQKEYLMFNQYIVSTKGLVGSKISENDNEKVKLIETMTEINRKLSSEILELKQQNTAFVKKNEMYIKLCDGFLEDFRQIISPEIKEIQRLQKFGKDFATCPDLLTDYLQTWGFTKEKSEYFCDEMGMILTKNFKKDLTSQDWEAPEGDVYKLTGLSDTSKRYLKCLYDNLNGNQSNLDDVIIKDICHNYRYQLQKAYSSGYEMAKRYQDSFMTDKILGLTGLRIELTWQDKYPLTKELLQLAAHGHWPTDEKKLAIYDQKLVIERYGPRDTLTVTFSEGLDRKLNAPLFQYAAEQGWYQEAVFAAMDNTQTWTDVQEIRLISGQWEKTRNAMQLVLRGAHGEEMAHAQKTEIVTISEMFWLGNGLRERLAKRLTEGLHLDRRHASGMDKYSAP